MEVASHRNYFKLHFHGIFYLAITNEPDYMPSQKQKAAEQHDMSKMSHEDMQNMQHSASEPMHNH